MSESRLFLQQENLLERLYLEQRRGVLYWLSTDIRYFGFEN